MIPEQHERVARTDADRSSPRTSFTGQPMSSHDPAADQLVIRLPGHTRLLRLAATVAGIATLAVLAVEVARLEGRVSHLTGQVRAQASPDRQALAVLPALDAKLTKV